MKLAAVLIFFVAFTAKSRISTLQSHLISKERNKNLEFISMLRVVLSWEMGYFEIKHSENFCHYSY